MEIIEPKGIIGEILKTGQQIQDDRIMADVFLHLSEEVGELATEISIHRGYSKKKRGVDGILGEAADIIICAVDILYTQGYPEEEIEHVIKQKLEKWRVKQQGL